MIGVAVPVSAGRAFRSSGRCRLAARHELPPRAARSYVRAQPVASFGTKSTSDPFGRRPTAKDPFGGGGAARQSRRKPTQTDHSPSQLDPTSLPCTPRVEEVPVFPVPKHMRRDGAAELSGQDNAYVSFVGLEELFPGSGLADLFDEDAAFRTALRRAAREDMFVPNPAFSPEANSKIKDGNASLMVSWRGNPPHEFANLTALFRERGVQGLDGPTFIGRLGGLVSGSEVSGSLIDIVGITNKRIRHSWHQDNGLDGQVTVMLGFPAEDRYSGAGVFSHIAKLSHALRQPGNEGEVIQFEDLTAAANIAGGDESAPPSPAEMEERYILRPIYRKGCEVVVYRDANHLHSAPDYAYRESLWRFM